MKTTSLWYSGERQLEVREIDLPEPGPNEALVEVDVCGVCTWDLFIFQGGFQAQKPYPFYFGHEGIGRVLAVGFGFGFGFVLGGRGHFARRERRPAGLAAYAIVRLVPVRLQGRHAVVLAPR